MPNYHFNKTQDFDFDTEDAKVHVTLKKVFSLANYGPTVVSFDSDSDYYFSATRTSTFCFKAHVNRT